jgi:long-chain acyl-CoA synthetase
MKFGGQNLLITNPRDLDGFLGILGHYQPTILTGVNTLFNAMMNHPAFASLDLRSLKLSVGGAMALQGAVVERWEQLTKSPLIEGYGLTETSPVACVNRVDGQDRKGTIGVPVPSTYVRLVTDEGQEITQLHERGELCVKGPQVMAGYWNRPDETANVLNDEGWLRTGDIAVWTEDYFLKIVDRKKDMILVSGFNVYPNEVEDVLAKHPGVKEVACIGVPDARSGEAVKVIVVPKHSGLREDEIRQFAQTNLTGYKQPKYVEIREAELPKSNVGKILRRVLREQEDARRAPAAH